jgi:FMN phosphatase YigB (HAD superfamily)
MASLMKVVFFDIDGVLNPRHAPNARKFPYVAEKRLVARFRRVVARTRAKPVMISTWRFDPAGLFSARHHGIPYRDLAPDMPQRPRGDEIIAWLKRHPNVTRFAVLDDDDDELDALPLFQPSAGAGFTPAVANAMEAYLLGKSDKVMRRNKLVRLAENALDTLTGHKG